MIIKDLLKLTGLILFIVALFTLGVWIDRALAQEKVGVAIAIGIEIS